jgi:uncharacterized protein with PhoU and TrkA domain
MAHRPLSALELPTVTGMRITAIRRGRHWLTEEIDGELALLPGDVLFLHGSAIGITRVRELAGAPPWYPPEADDGRDALSDLDRAIDVLVEMKNLSEVAVGLAYSALVLRDAVLAAEVRHLEDRLDEMKQRLELWVLRAAGTGLDPGQLRGLLNLAQAAEDIGDHACQMVWLVAGGEELHPILAIAFGDSDEVFAQMPVAPGAEADGASLAELKLDLEPGFHVMAIRRGGGYLYRPRGSVRLLARDELLVRGPYHGREPLAKRLGWHLELDEDTGEIELTSLGAGHRPSDRRER